MKVIYRAFDGAEFETEAACRYHETENPNFVMWGEHGQVDNIGETYVVEIKNEIGIRSFIKVASAWGCDCDEVDDVGFYYYNNWRNSFELLDETMIKILRNCLINNS